MNQPYVQIYRLQNDGSQKVVATCKLDGETVACEGEPGFVEPLKNRGIYDYRSDEPQKLYPHDGLAFLQNLKFAFKSGYVNATDVQMI